MAAVVVVVVIVGGLLACGAITGLKGKFGFLAGGLVVHLLWIVGAIRLAKPGSWWARRFYDESKQAQAAACFGGVQPALSRRAPQLP